MRTYQEAYILAMSDSLPVESPDWYLVDPYGLSLAYQVSILDKLPLDFPQVHLELFIKKASNGYNPAFWFSQYHILPLDFPRWDVGQYPYNLRSLVHRTVEFHKTLPDGFIDKHLNLFIQGDAADITPAHMYALHHTIPLNFPHWGLADKAGDTIAHYAAMNNHLPPGFEDRYPQIWRLKNKKGFTVECNSFFTA